MPPKFTIPSYSLFLVSGLIHTVIGVTGLLLLKAPAVAKPIFGNLTAQQFILPQLESSSAGNLALEMMLTGMLCFAGIPGLLVAYYKPNDRKSVLPMAFPAAAYHLYHLLVLYSSFLNMEGAVLGPSESVVPVMFVAVLNELVKTYRVRLWILNSAVHFFIYVWYVIWIVRVQETGGVPGFKRSTAKGKTE
ncbi:hypothetical protein BC830DRAFT_1164130 [Chytriomyces sp. MP71]|nr:hypothetical protein BC830DRAFT_1164130 [Chytriomyces sp. MP71]